MFSFVFDSDNSVVDIVADEMLNQISTKRDDSGSVRPLGQCVFNAPRAQRKVNGTIIVTLTVNTST